MTWEGVGCQSGLFSLTWVPANVTSHETESHPHPSLTFFCGACQPCEIVTMRQTFQTLVFQRLSVFAVVNLFLSPSMLATAIGCFGVRALSAQRRPQFLCFSSLRSVPFCCCCFGASPHHFFYVFPQLSPPVILAAMLSTMAQGGSSDCFDVICGNGTSELNQI